MLERTSNPFHFTSVTQELSWSTFPSSLFQHSTRMLMRATHSLAVPFTFSQRALSASAFSSASACTVILEAELAASSSTFSLFSHSDWKSWKRAKAFNPKRKEKKRKEDFSLFSHRCLLLDLLGLLEGARLAEPLLLPPLRPAQPGLESLHPGLELGPELDVLRELAALPVDLLRQRVHALADLLHPVDEPARTVGNLLAILMQKQG